MDGEGNRESGRREGLFFLLFSSVRGVSRNRFLHTDYSV